MKDDKIIYSTSPEIVDNLLRIIFLLGIVSLVINFSVNPVAFSFLISILTLLVLAVTTHKITIGEDGFEIKSYSALWLWTKTHSFRYQDIKTIKSETGWFYKIVLFVPFMDFIFGVSIEVILKNDRVYNFDLEGLKWKEVKKCLSLINERI